MNNSKTAILPQNPSLIPCAKKISDQFKIPLILKPNPQYLFLLELSSEHLSLNYTPNPKFNNIIVDFLKGKTRHRRLYGGGKGQLIARACGLKKIKNPKIIDATAGLGADAFVLASLGCDVLMIERSSILAALLQDGLNRLKQNPELSQQIQLQLMNQNAIEYLKKNYLNLHNNPNDQPDIIYLDPMYPHREQSALVKKEMRILRKLVGDDHDADKLFEIAMKIATHRVVVKRPRLAPTINDKIPNLVLKGKSSRFDVYILIV